jgi:hypothetical protein
LKRFFKNEKREYRQNPKKIREFFQVLLFCRMNAMTATGIRERIHGMPDFCVVAGTGGTTVCTVPDWDVAISDGVETGVSVLFAGMVDGIIVVPDVPVGVGLLN